MKGTQVAAIMGCALAMGLLGTVWVVGFDLCLGRAAMVWGLGISVCGAAMMAWETLQRWWARLQRWDSSTAAPRAWLAARYSLYMSKTRAACKSVPQPAHDEMRTLTSRAAEARQQRRAEEREAERRLGIAPTLQQAVAQQFIFAAPQPPRPQPPRQQRRRVAIVRAQQQALAPATHCVHTLC
ncbi:hypothetical protein ABPG75_001675 [Micractinium tetrahymenae]